MNNATRQEIKREQLEKLREFEKLQLTKHKKKNGNDNTTRK